MQTRPKNLIPTVLLAALIGAAGRLAAAQQFTIDFEKATNIPDQPDEQFEYVQRGLRRLGHSE